MCYQKCEKLENGEWLDSELSNLKCGDVVRFIPTEDHPHVNQKTLPAKVAMCDNNGAYYCGVKFEAIEPLDKVSEGVINGRKAA